MVYLFHVPKLTLHPIVHFANVISYKTVRAPAKSTRTDNIYSIVTEEVPEGRLA
ncbi:MAG: hypothetical protein ACI819_001557 [Neolewinella sp.]|jgi:hypothetical protein